MELDENQDSQISLEKFVTGFKKLVLKQPPLPTTSVPADHSQAMTFLNEAMNRSLKKVLADVAQRVGMNGDAPLPAPPPAPPPGPPPESDDDL